MSGRQDPVALVDCEVLGTFTVTMQAGGEVIRFAATPSDTVKSAIMAGPL